MGISPPQFCTKSFDDSMCFLRLSLHNITFGFVSLLFFLCFPLEDSATTAAATVIIFFCLSPSHHYSSSKGVLMLCNKLVRLISCREKELFLCDMTCVICNWHILHSRWQKQKKVSHSFFLKNWYSWTKIVVILESI